MQNIIKCDEYLSRIIDRKENGLIKVITGIRRCGKSFLLFNLFYDYLIESGVKEEQIITIAPDDDMRKGDFRRNTCRPNRFISDRLPPRVTYESPLRILSDKQINYNLIKFHNEKTPALSKRFFCFIGLFINTFRRPVLLPLLLRWLRLPEDRAYLQQVILL